MKLKWLFTAASSNTLSKFPLKLCKNQNKVGSVVLGRADHRLHQLASNHWTAAWSGNPWRDVTDPYGWPKIGWGRFFGNYVGSSYQLKVHLSWSFRWCETGNIIVWFFYIWHLIYLYIYTCMYIILLNAGIEIDIWYPFSWQIQVQLGLGMLRPPQSYC